MLYEVITNIFNNRSPASVNDILRVVRLNKRMSMRLSSALIAWLSADCEIPSWAAALVKLSSLAKTIKNRITSYNVCYTKLLRITQAKKPEQMRAAMILLMPIVDAYHQELSREGAIDFDDMIGQAYAYVRDGLFQSRWKYILIDEYQDISLPRAKLVKALRNQQPEGSLFCVGDDWQSIYRFTGSDIHLTSGFPSVITSYSIHYTKLYECISNNQYLKPCQRMW